jgi:hypothetical protein
MLAMSSGSGGSSVKSLVKFTINHPTVNDNNFERKVTVDGTDIVNDTFTGTNQGNDFDMNVDFTVNGHAVNWRSYFVYGTTSPYVLPVEMTVDGVKYTYETTTRMPNWSSQGSADFYLLL